MKPTQQNNQPPTSENWEIRFDNRWGDGKIKQLSELIDKDIRNELKAFIRQQIDQAKSEAVGEYKKEILTKLRELEIKKQIEMPSAISLKELKRADRESALRWWGKGEGYFQALQEIINLITPDQNK